MRTKVYNPEEQILVGENDALIKVVSGKGAPGTGSKIGIQRIAATKPVVLRCLTGSATLEDTGATGGALSGSVITLPLVSGRGFNFTVKFTNAGTEYIQITNVDELATVGRTEGGNVTYLFAQSDSATHWNQLMIDAKYIHRFGRVILTRFGDLNIKGYNQLFGIYGDIRYIDRKDTEYTFYSDDMSYAIYRYMYGDVANFKTNKAVRICNSGAIYGNIYPLLQENINIMLKGAYINANDTYDLTNYRGYYFKVDSNYSKRFSNESTNCTSLSLLVNLGDTLDAFLDYVAENYTALTKLEVYGDETDSTSTKIAAVKTANSSLATFNVNGESVL